MWRTWPILSAKIVAQKPGDSVIPPLSPAQAAELPELVCASAGDPVAASAAIADAEASKAAVMCVLLRLRRAGFGTRGLVDPVLAMAMLHMSGCLKLMRCRVLRVGTAGE